MSNELRVDLHVKVLDERVVARAKERGLDALVYAPHFRPLPEIRERAVRYSDDDLLVLAGREVFTGTWRDRKHVLAVGLTDPVPDFVTLEGAMAEFARQDAVVLVPHPTFMTVSLTESDIRRYRDAIDAVEVYNPKHLPFHDRRAAALADALDLPAFGSSYAHLRGSVGEVWTAFEGVERDGEAILAALRSGAPRRVAHRSGTGHRLHRAAEFVHLFYENSWEKVDRVLLSGRESTHPDQRIYDSRFDDVAVY